MGAETVGNMHGVIRRCGAKQFGIQKYVTQTVSLGALLETELLKKKYAIVVRNACRCQNCQKLSGSEHFWKLRLRWWKSVRRGGAKDW